MEPENTSPHDGQRLPSLAVADLLRTTVRLYIRHWRMYVLIMAVVALPLMLITEATRIASLIEPVPIRRAPATSTLTANQIVTLVSSLLRTLAQSAVVVFAAHALRGEPLTVLNAFTFAAHRFRAIVAFSVLVALATFPARISMPTVFLPFWALVGWILVGIALLLSWQQVYQALLLERRSVFSAIRRSWELTNNHWLRLAACLLPLYMIQEIPTAAVPFFWGLFVALSRQLDLPGVTTLVDLLVPLGVDEDRAAGLSLRLIIESVALPWQVLATPLIPILTTVFYVRRTAHEAAARTATSADQPEP